jgi:hypothetical protein
MRLIPVLGIALGGALGALSRYGLGALTCVLVSNLAGVFAVWAGIHLLGRG